MVDHGRLRFTQLLVAAWPLVACSSTPSLARDLTIVKGERTSVRLVQPGGTNAFSLQNASAQASTAVYTENSHEIDPGVKIISDGNLQTLLDVFATKGMFATSVSEVPPGSLEVLIVEQGKRRWVWAVSADKRARLAAIQRGDHSDATFSEARQEFLTLYNTSMAFHGAGDERPNFKAENDRVKAENRDTQRSHR